VSFADLSPAAAEAYRAQVAADGPARLFELAQRLTSDGIALDEFDASIPSVTPLWRWYVEFARADFPGIHADAQPRKESVEPQGSGVARAGYAAELIVHYLFEVARRCLTGVEWVTDPNVDTGDYQRTAVHYVDDDGYRGLEYLDRAIAGTTQMFLQGIREECAEPDYLTNAFLDGLFPSSLATAARCRALPRGTSVLGPPLSAGPPEITETVPVPGPATPPPASAATSTDDEDAGGELVFAHMTADVEALEDAPPIDAAAMAEVLAALGFRDPSGAGPTRDALLAEEFAEFVRADDAMVTTLVAGGELRAVQLASISPSAASWTEITGGLAQLAGPMGARLAPEDEF
jgi:hypothetical protein